MKGLCFAVIPVLMAICQSGQPDNPEGVEFVEVGYGELKSLFDDLAGRLGVEIIQVPRALNWIVRKRLKRELEAENIGSANLAERIEEIVLVSYDKVKGEEESQLKCGIDSVLRTEVTETAFMVILSGWNENDGSFSRLAVHSKESKSFIILKGIFKFSRYVQNH